MHDKEACIRDREDMLRDRRESLDQVTARQKELWYRKEAAKLYSINPGMRQAAMST